MDVTFRKIDAIIDEIKKGRFEITQSVIENVFRERGIEDSAISVALLKSTPSFIFRLQRLRKVASLSSDGKTLLISGEDSKDVKNDGKAVPEAVKKVEIKFEFDADFYVKPDVYDLVDKALLNKQTVFCYGPTGCGKSFMFEKIAKSHSWKFKRFELNGDMSKEDIFGFYEFKGGETKWVDGILPMCMKQGMMLVFEELDIALSEILMILQKVLEKNPDGTFKTLYNPMNGEEVIAAEGFLFACTANTCGKGDDTSLYTATHPINEAFLDRLALVLRFDYPSIEDEVMILRKTEKCDVATARMVADLASGVRSAFKEGSVYSTFSLRKEKNFTKMIVDGVPKRLALRATILDRATKEDAAKITEIYQRIFGSK